MKIIIIIFLLTFKVSSMFSQGLMVAMASGPSAYIPKTKVLGEFPLYPTINKYDFKGKPIKIEFKDLRDSLKIIKIECSDIAVDNKTKFKTELGSKLVKSYIDSLFVNSNLQLVDSINSEIISVKLNVLDSKKNGLLIPKVHGICQMDFTYKKLNKTYCIDLKDGDNNAPVGRMTVISIQRAKELLICSSIREVIEQFLRDLENYKDN